MVDDSLLCCMIGVKLLTTTYAGRPTPEAGKAKWERKQFDNRWLKLKWWSVDDNILTAE